MAKSKFFRVAVEGATVDGRTIDRKWIEEMAASYNPATYAARVNLEHIRGASPLTNQTPFGAYGDVLAVKAEEITLSLDGKDEKRLALFAEINALDPLITLNQAGQKLYTSIEINPSFAGTGKAYLMGIAVTDSPASLGTEMLQFAATLGDKSPLASRKQQPGNYFSAAAEADIQMADAPASTDATGLMAAMTGFFNRFTAPAAPAPVAAAAPAAEPPSQGGSGKSEPSEFAAFGLAMGQMVAAINNLATTTTTQLSAITARVDGLESKLTTTAAPGQTARLPATGASSDFVKTDC